MKRHLVIVTIAILAFSLFGADLAGTWKGSMETQMGQTDIAITFQSGATPTGKVQAGEYEGPIEKVKLAGESISFVANIAPGTLTFEGTVAGDEMKLDVTGTQGNKYKLVCKRQK